jgi:hypothetical protein
LRGARRPIILPRRLFHANWPRLLSGHGASPPRQALRRHSRRPLRSRSGRPSRRRLALGKLIGGQRARRRIADAAFEAEALAIERARGAWTGEIPCKAPHPEEIEERRAKARHLRDAAADCWADASQLPWEIDPQLSGLWAVAKPAPISAHWLCDEPPAEEMAQAAARELRALAEEIFGPEAVLFGRVISAAENSAASDANGGKSGVQMAAAIRAAIEQRELVRAARAASAEPGLAAATSDGPVSVQAAPPARRKPRSL